MLLSDLIEKTHSALKPFHYKDGVLRRINIEFRAVEDYFLSCGQKFFSKDLLEKYIDSAKSDYAQQKFSKSKFHRIRGAVDKLIQCYEQGDIKWRILPYHKGSDKQTYDDALGVFNDYGGVLLS